MDIRTRRHSAGLPPLKGEEGSIAKARLSRSGSIAFQASNHLNDDEAEQSELTVGTLGSGSSDTPPSTTSTIASTQRLSTSSSKFFTSHSTHSLDSQQPPKLTKASVERLKAQLVEANEEVERLKLLLSACCCQSNQNESAEAHSRIMELERTVAENDIRIKQLTKKNASLELLLKASSNQDKNLFEQEIVTLKKKLKEKEAELEEERNHIPTPRKSECDECPSLKKEIAAVKQNNAELLSQNCRRMQEITLMKDHFVTLAEKLKMAMLNVGKSIVSTKLTIHVVQPELRMPDGALAPAPETCSEQLTKAMKEMVTVFWSDPACMTPPEVKEKTQEIVQALVTDVKKYLKIPAAERSGKLVSEGNDYLFGNLEDA